MKFFVKQVRQEKDLSLRQLAKKSGVSKTGVEEIDAGTANPTLGTLNKLARALEVPVWELFCCENCENGRCEREETEKMARHIYCTDMPHPHCASSVCPGCGHRVP